MQGLTISPVWLDGVCTLILAGELDVASAPKLNVAIDAAMQGDPAELVIDVGDVTFIDSSGLGTFVWAKRRGEAPVVLRRPSPQCRQLLELTNLQAEFDITD